MTAVRHSAARLQVSPYARRLARERGISLDQLRGSGPHGRVVAADILAFVPNLPAAAPAGNFAALGTTIQLTTLRGLLAEFAKAETPFALDDVVLRAFGCALDDVDALHLLEGQPISIETQLEHGRGQFVLENVRKGSLAPLRARRLAALALGLDQSQSPAIASLRLLDAHDIKPLAMPLLPDRALRLVVAIGPDTAETLLSFDAGIVDEDAAAAVLTRFKGYLEVPLRLLA